MRFTWTNRAAPFFQIGTSIRVDAGNARWDSVQWDKRPLAEWVGYEPTWEDLSCEVFDFQCEYGRAALVDRFVPGSATILVRNYTGWADPEQLKPGRPMRVGIDHVTLGRRIIFRGFIDAIVPTYSPGSLDVVEVQCIDALAEVNRAQLSPYPEPQNPDEQAHLRVERILTRAKWPPDHRDIRPTSWELIAHEQGGQVADLLGQIADSIGGSVWGGYNGEIAFRGRDWQMFSPITTPIDATIGNVGPDDVCPGVWQRPFDRASISTQVVLGRNPETAVVVEDLPGQALYGIEPFVRTDLLTANDGQLLDLAERTLATRSHLTAPRVRSVNLDARNGDEQLDLLATVDVYQPSHYRCRLLTGGRLVFDDRYIATGVAHHITADVWSLELNLDRAWPYAASGGRWDGAWWDQSSWIELAEPLLEEAVAALAGLETP